MRLATIVLTLSLCTSICQAQLEKGDNIVSIKAGLLDIKGFESRYYGGFEFEKILRDGIGIHYNRPSHPGYSVGVSLSKVIKGSKSQS